MSSLPRPTGSAPPDSTPGDASTTGIVPAERFEQLREAREILQLAAQSLQTVARRLDDRFCHAVRLLLDCTGAVVVTGMGKAGLIGRKLTATLSSTGTRALFLHPAEAVHGDLGVLRPGDVLLALSNSGETEELCRMLPHVRRQRIPIVAITARETSTLGSQADALLATGSISEAGWFGLAPTTSTSVMLAVGDALALVACRQRGFSREDFAQVHPAGALGRRLCAVSDLMRQGDQLRIAPQDLTVRQALVSHQRAGRRTGAIMAVDEAGRLAGLFTDSDLARLLEQRRESQLDRPLAEVMTHLPKTISCDAPLADACKLLADFHISELPVIDGLGRPVGLIDITDVITHMPEQRTD
jgi:arabinose-5-phosphate isomerase